MAVEQSGAQTPDEAPSADQDGTRGDAAGQPDLSEVKRRFREALDRKRGAHAGATAEGAHDTGKVHGSHGPAASRRSFRRKSGG
jgi:hypothetical protein